MTEIGDEAAADLRILSQKWISQARHPQRSRQPEVRDALMKCAADLQELLFTYRATVPAAKTGRLLTGTEPDELTARRNRKP